MNLRKAFQRWRQRQKIVLTDLTAVPLQFVTQSPVERYRIAQYGEERDSLLYFLQQLHPDDVLFDIGASVGLYAAAAATQLTQGHLYAFEPDPETMDALKQNIALNKLSNVSFLPWAVSDEDGEITLFSDGVAGRAPTLAKQSRPHAPEGTISVPKSTLDGAIARGELPVPTVLKMDIEGAEILALRGCKGLLNGRFQQRPRLIMLEIHPLFLPDFGATAEETKAILTDAGYTLIWELLRHDQEHLCYVADAGGGLE
ncbi:MAG: FkbM family methyltransferase [Chloroflexota bacterium]